MRKKILPILIIAVFSLLAAQWMLTPSATPAEKRQHAEKVNLALRQVGHELLLETGDDSSRINPIKQISDNEFILNLESEFNYDTLPSILSAVFENFQIDGHYQVNIKECDSDTIVLGYDQMAVKSGEVACVGREQAADCSNISVVFSKNNAFSIGKFILFTLGFVGISALVFLIFFRGSEQKNPVSDSKKEINSNQVEFGQSALEVSNQLYLLNNVKKELTFRETKLLHFFAQHPNQVLEREKILSSVWEDEGVIVGRSLDVFVSRLRKILKGDESVKIKNVHGVGYKLEIIDS
ncbi:MAG: helix-turn-helix domain-containing protein [Bacteroidota bacterium]